MKAVVLGGKGEIGMALVGLCRTGYTEVYIDDPHSPSQPPEGLKVDALHVAIPGAHECFMGSVLEAACVYEPSIILVHSTTPPGTCRSLAIRLGEERLVHAQVHGKHSGGRMLSDMLRYPKFVATPSDEAWSRAVLALTRMGHVEDKILRMRSYEQGELTKLLATTFYGYLIAWVQEVERLAKAHGLECDQLMEFTELDTTDFDIHGTYPGVIQGHCVLPNVRLLQEIHPSPFWELILASNKLKEESSED